jgi:hypothetical protein
MDDSQRAPGAGEVVSGSRRGGDVEGVPDQAVDSITRKPTRLSVNISRDTFEALQEIASDKGITMTEAVRRLVGYGIIVYRASRDGYEVLLRRDGKLEKILIVD